MAIDKRYLLVVAAMCGLSMATVGLITNIAGLFFIPMAEEYGVLQGVASLTLTIANICVAVGGLATRKLTKLMSLKALLIAGAAVLAGSNLGTAFSPNIGITYALSVTKGLAGGVVGFVLITYVLNKWFQKKLGLVTSIAMGCSGLAGAIFTPIVQPVVQNMGWRAGQVLVSVFMVLLCLPAILFVPSCDPKDAGLVPFGESKTVASSVSQDKCASIRVNKMLAALVFLYAVLAAAVSSMPQHFPGLAVEAGLTVGVGAAMISSCMIANTAGKIVMGWLTDRIGARSSIITYTVAVCTSIIALLVVRAPAAFVVAAFFFGLCYSRATVGLSMMCRELFGKRGFGIVYPVAALGCSFSNAVFSSAVGFGYDLTGGYTVSLITFFVFLVGSGALVVWCYKVHASSARRGPRSRRTRNAGTVSTTGRRRLLLALFAGLSGADPGLGAARSSACRRATRRPCSSYTRQA